MVLRLIRHHNGVYGNNYKIKADRMRREDREEVRRMINRESLGLVFIILIVAGGFAFLAWVDSVNRINTLLNQSYWECLEYKEVLNIEWLKEECDFVRRPYQSETDEIIIAPNGYLLCTICELTESEGWYWYDCILNKTFQENKMKKICIKQVFVRDVGIESKEEEGCEECQQVYIS